MLFWKLLRIKSVFELVLGRFEKSIDLGERSASLLLLQCCDVEKEGWDRRGRRLSASGGKSNGRLRINSLSGSSSLVLNVLQRCSVPRRVHVLHGRWRSHCDGRKKAELMSVRWSADAKGWREMDRSESRTDLDFSQIAF